MLALCSCTALVDLSDLSAPDAGSTDASVGVDARIDGPCIPRTCESIGANCGPVADGCGSIIKKNGAESCGSCTGGLTCAAVKDNVCGSPPLYSGAHSENDCKTAVGQVRGIGFVGDAGPPQSLCEFAGSKCPAGWTRLANWGSTTASTAGPCGCNGGTCKTAFHAFSDAPAETCAAPCKQKN